MVMNKKGVSPVVATVLLLVLTIVIGAVVFSVVLPFVNKSLGESKSCLDVFDSVEFPESKFNCVISGNPGMTGFSIKINKDEINGVKVALIDSSGNSDVFDIRKDAQYPELKMAGAITFGDLLGFPTVGGQKTYVANKVYEKAEISALTDSGDVCSVADVIEFKICSTGVNL